MINSDLGEANETDPLADTRNSIREVQCKIQDTKKHCKSADKKEKKLLQDELDRLETEKTKLEALRTALLERKTLASDNAPSSRMRPSRKARLTKSQQWEAQLESYRSSQGHLPSLPSADSLEQVSMSRLLEVDGLELVEMPADGHCLFYALSHQLKERYEKEVSHLELRRDIANYIRSHIDDFLPYFYEEDQPENLVTNEEDLRGYCDLIENTAEWGGQQEIVALSNLHRLPIFVYQANCPVIKTGENFAGPPLRISYHHHSFGLGEHYNSLVDDQVLARRN